MNGFSLIFQVVILAAVAIVFGVVVAAAARFAFTVSHMRTRKHVPRTHRG